MKPRFIAIAVLCIVLFVPQASRAATMAVGLNSWLNWWEIPKENMEQHYVKIDFRVVPNFLFGPMISFQITPRWNLSSLFMLGEYDDDSLSHMFDSDNYDYTIWRYDSDTTVCYTFTSYFRFYFGFKYFRYTWEYTYDNSGLSDFNGTLFKKLSTVSDNYAPGIGVIFTITLHQALYLSFSMGAMFSFTQMDQKYQVTDYDTDGITYNYSDEYFGYEVGLNSKLSLCYDIEPIHVIVSTGFRYQVFFYFFDNGGKIKYSDRVDHMYGIDLSGTFYFDI